MLGRIEQEPGLETKPTMLTRSLVTTLPAPAEGAVLGLAIHFPFLFLREADLRHCFLLRPWLPASWLVEDRCLFVMHVAPGGPLVARQGGGTSTRSNHGPFALEAKALWGESNLVGHPVGALLPQAQGRRDKTQQFVHVLIANPPAERDETCGRGLAHTAGDHAAASQWPVQAASQW